MLLQAEQKVAVSGLTNIRFEKVDADEQEFQESQFDVILCSSAIVLVVSVRRRTWRLNGKVFEGAIMAWARVPGAAR